MGKRPGTARDLAVLRLQRRAGNRATAQLLQRFGVDDVKDAYKHVQDWLHPDKKTPEAEADWTENSEEVARHAKQAIELSKAAYEHAASEAMRTGNSEALEQARRASEQVEEAGKLLESGERVFKWGAKTAKVIQELDEMYEAAEKLKDADLGDPATQRDAAAALDTLAGGFGKLGGEITSGSPVKGYFDFLAEFSGAHFFAHWAGFVHNYTDRIMSYSDDR